MRLDRNGKNGLPILIRCDNFVENNTHSVFRGIDCCWNSVSDFLKPV